MVYLLHFTEPYKHAAHYLGFTTDLPARLAEHAAGHGARLTQVVKAAGIGWSLTRVWTEATRVDERRLKNQHGAARFCPTCGARPRKPAIPEAVRAALPPWVLAHASHGPVFSLTHICVRCGKERGLIWGETWPEGWVCFACIDCDDSGWLDSLPLPSAEARAHYARPVGLLTAA